VARYIETYSGTLLSRWPEFTSDDGAEVGMLHFRFGTPAALHQVGGLAVIADLRVPAPG